MVGPLRIGELAELSHVSIDAIRYYERRGLLPRAARTAGGYRVFTQDAIERIRFIKQAQEMGFSLDEIKQLFGSGGGVNRCRAVREFLLEKLSNLEIRMNQMRNFKKVLRRHLDECNQELRIHGEQATCPVLFTIEKTKTTHKTNQ